MAGLTPLTGYQQVSGFGNAMPEATPAEMHGGPADPRHANWGEAAQPYSWESQLTNYHGHTGPYGSENEMLGDEYALAGEAAGTLNQDPFADMTPYRSHAAPTNVTLSGALPSQYDAINQELVQGAENRGVDLGASRKFSTTEYGLAQQDNWQEIWDTSTSPEKYPASPKWLGFTAFGFGTNDRPSNPLAKVNQYAFNEGHHHRRFAVGSIPGNYMWMKPGSRPMYKTVAGPARPAIGEDSPFTGHDLGETFGIQGAVLVEVPQEYQSPPSPQMAAPINFDEPAPSIPLW